MAIINCIIVDDEPPAIKILEKYAAEVESLKVIGTCNNVFKAMDFLHAEKIDLIFLDINMPKISGLDFIKTLPNPPKVIFTTAYKEFAIDAFDLNAIDYLLKPFSLERFIKSVNKIILQYPQTIDSITFNNMPLFLYFRADRKMIKVFLDDILYIESLKDYVKIHLADRTPLVVKQTISNIEAMLPEAGFLRIHRSFIVSLSKMTAYTNKDVEIGKVELPIGRVYSNIFSKSLSKNEK